MNVDAEKIGSDEREFPHESGRPRESIESTDVAKPEFATKLWHRVTQSWVGKTAMAGVLAAGTLGACKDAGDNPSQNQDPDQNRPPVGATENCEDRSPWTPLCDVQLSAYSENGEVRGKLLFTSDQNAPVRIFEIPEMGDPIEIASFNATSSGPQSQRFTCDSSEDRIRIRIQVGNTPADPANDRTITVSPSLLASSDTPDPYDE